MEVGEPHQSCGDPAGERIVQCNMRRTAAGIGRDVLPFGTVERWIHQHVIGRAGGDTGLRKITRADVEELFFREAELLDAWQLDEWLGLLTEDAVYHVPPNDLPDADPRYALFIIADDRERIRQRVIRALDPNCHAEHPRSRISRIVGNVRVLDDSGNEVSASANFCVYRIRRGDITVHNEGVLHGSGGNTSRESYRRAYIVALRSESTVAEERRRGFTHSHNDSGEVLDDVDGLRADS